MRKNFVVLLFAILSSVSVCAQSGGFNSPFSRFGIGDLVDPNPMYLRHMGGVNAAYADNYHINHVNPASLPYLRATAFDIGISANNINLKDAAGNTRRDWSGNLEYLTLAFPLQNPLNEVFERERKEFRFAMGFSLLPVSRVEYHILNDDTDPVIGAFNREFLGTGGIYKVQWGNGLQYKGFSFGVNLGYQFGKISYDRVIDFAELTAFDNRFTNDYSLKGFTYNVGAIYQYVLNRDEVIKNPTHNAKAINIGLYGNSQTSFRTESSFLNQNQFAGGAVGLVTDTLSFGEEIKGNGTLPGQLGIGVNYFVGGELSLGVNYVLTAWNNYENEANPEQLSNANKLSIGGFYRPNIKSFNYRDRIYYRFGATIGQGARSIEQNQLENFSVNLGLGLPFVYQRKISHINLGVEAGRRSAGNILSETFVKLGIGLTFNDDEWFIKRKYN